MNLYSLSSNMKTVIIIILFCVGLSFGDIQTGLVGVWKFDDPSDLSKAEVGNDLTLVGTDAAIEGIDEFDGAVNIGVGSHYIAEHTIAPNGGGSYVNEWTFVVDFRYPAPGWHCFFQTNQGNSNDGDCFVHTNTGALGVGSTGYTGRYTMTNTWYRMVVTVDNGSFYRIYVNGELWMDGTVQSIDGRFSLDPTVLLFADENGEDKEMHVSMVAMYDRALSGSDVSELKGPGGDEVVHELELLTDPYLQNVKQDGITIMWELSTQADCAVEYGVDGAFDLASGCTFDPSGAGTYIYKSVIAGLQADTAYDFRVVVNDETLADQMFTTAPVGYANFSFGVWETARERITTIIRMTLMSRQKR